MNDTTSAQIGFGDGFVDARGCRQWLKTLPLTKLQDLADTRVAQKISQLPGVGLVSISGGQRPAVRIQVNPKALAAYGLSLEDVRTSIANANTNQAKGSFDGPYRASTIDANDQLKSADEYRSLIIAFRNGAPVRVQDVADTVDGAIVTASLRESVRRDPSLESSVSDCSSCSTIRPSMR